MGLDTLDDLELARAVLHQITQDLGLLVDCSFAVDQVTAERSTRRAAGQGSIHISFKLAFERAGELRHGCLLLPLPEAITLAGLLLQNPPEEIEEQRGDTDLDRVTKDAMLELGNFVGGSCEGGLRPTLEDCRVRSEGCQGVRAGVPPKLLLKAGEVLVVARARGTLEPYPPFDLLLMIPALDPDPAGP